jgi:hypothetical protein
MKLNERAICSENKQTKHAAPSRTSKEDMARATSKLSPEKRRLTRAVAALAGERAEEPSTEQEAPGLLPGSTVLVLTTDDSLLEDCEEIIPEHVFKQPPRIQVPKANRNVAPLPRVRPGQPVRFLPWLFWSSTRS